jgi:hypothetical protein
MEEADRAVAETIEAAAYLASQRERLAPRKLVLSAQGVDPFQYRECAQEILKHMQPGDSFAFGGWCILGQVRSLLPKFMDTIQLTMPLVAKAGITDVHIFGVLYLPALGTLLALADKYNINLSVDSTTPVLACTYKDKRRSGARADHWRDNIIWWENTLANLRASEHYKLPPPVEAFPGEVFA